MPNKRNTGNFVKDAMTEDFLEKGFDQIYSLSISTTQPFFNKDFINEDGTRGREETRFVQTKVDLGHDSVLKILKLLNPKRVRWQMGEAPTAEAKEKYGAKARWTWSDYDFVQLRLS